jgi:putative colanic acid biosynthesis glycosyltransferase WcaI
MDKRADIDIKLPVSESNIPSVTILYHFFHPDDVVSARHFSDMAEEFVQRGWNVRVLTSNRYCRYPKKKISDRKEIWRNILIHRVSRPSWDQSRNIQRLLNSAWMIAGWSWQVLRSPKTDYYIVGSDPQFSQIIFPFLKLFSKHKQIVYWCFDLFPEAIIVDNKSRVQVLLAMFMSYITAFCYKFVNIAVDLGPCMKKRLKKYAHFSRITTFTPWALKEPKDIPNQDQKVRNELFGQAKLGLLYSGNLGAAHEYKLFLKLARQVKEVSNDIIFTFACRGNRTKELYKDLRDDDVNVRIASFAPESELEKRLAAADIHLLSLRENWDGIVVPSKFFGSLAVGRPLLYSGSKESDIGKWIQKYGCGLILDGDDNNMDRIIVYLLSCIENKTKLQEWQENAFRAYHENFSKKIVMDGWDEMLRSN